MSTLSQRLAKLDAVERRKAMDERNAKRRAEYAVRPKVLLWDDPARERLSHLSDKKTGSPDHMKLPSLDLIDADFDDLCNWYSSDDLPARGAQDDE